MKADKRWLKVHPHRVAAGMRAGVARLRARCRSRIAVAGTL